MGTPLDLEALGAPGKRHVAAVKETERAVERFTQGGGALGVRQNGNLVPLRNSEGTDGEDAFVMSRIGRNFRSF